MTNVFSSLYIYIYIYIYIAEEAEKANAAATKFLQEQTSRKSKLPIYEGLERFELVEKIGE
jgi:hypothetical protein